MNYKIDHFEIHDDKRGRLVVFLQKKGLPKQFKTFGQIYFVTFNKKNVIRGNHYHKKWCEWFGLVTGKAEVKLKDINTEEEVSLILDTNKDKYVRLRIGPNIVHAFKSLSSHAALLNYANKEWEKEDTYFYKLM